MTTRGRIPRRRLRLGLPGQIAAWRVVAARAAARRGARRGRPTTPGQLRRTRWLLTALFTSITAICLVVLGAVAASIDAHSRDSELDSGIDKVVTGLAREVYWNEDGSVDLETVRQDDDLAQGPRAVAVLVRGATGQWYEQFAHKRTALPVDMTELAQQVAHAEDTQWHTLTDRNGHRVRVAAAPAWDNQARPTVGAVVFAGADPAPGTNNHRRLVMALQLGGLALVALAALAGHLLSGVSMRPAVRTLGEQERFLSDAAHELRTPLATMRLHLDAALRDAADSRRAVIDARSLIDRMGRLVSGLLARTRTETGLAQLDVQRLYLDQLVEGVLAESGGEVELRTEPTVVQADPDLLTLAVRNLIDNAIVHGRTGVEVTVAEGRVTVRDRGPGLDPAVSDPFRRGATGGGGHHGIGLSIVQWVARAHNGSVTLRSAAGGGTIATLTLALAAEEPRTPPSGDALPNRASGAGSPP